MVHFLNHTKRHLLLKVESLWFRRLKINLVFLYCLLHNQQFSNGPLKLYSNLITPIRDILAILDM